MQLVITHGKLSDSDTLHVCAYIWRIFLADFAYCLSLPIKKKKMKTDYVVFCVFSIRKVMLLDVGKFCHMLCTTRKFCDQTALWKVC